MRLHPSLLLLGPLLAGTAAAQDEPAADAPICERNATASEVQLAIDAAQASWADLEIETFVANTNKIRAMVPCMSEELIRPHVARLHRFEGLRSFVDEDVEGAKAAFAASRTIEPNYRFPTSIVPEGNPVHEVFDAKEARDPAQEPIGAPSSGRIQLDGALTLQRHTDLPMVVQLFSEDGAVATTTYVHAGEPLPAYDALAIGDNGGYKYDGSSTGRAMRVPLGVGAAITGVAAIGLYSVAMSKKSAWNNDDTPVSELEGLRASANVLGGAGVGVGVIAVGLGAGAVVAGRF